MHRRNCYILPMPFSLIAGFNDDDEDDDENDVVKIYRPRRGSYNKNFKDLYRFNQQNIDFLVNTFMDINHETRGGALNNRQKIKTFLRYIGDPGFQVIFIEIKSGR